jgi:hypothetical protein
VKRRRLSLGWIDFLVIAASILTFAAVAGATIGYGSNKLPCCRLSAVAAETETGTTNDNCSPDHNVPQEAIMNNGQNKNRAIAVPAELRKSRFSWIDLLVIAAALLTLAVVVDASTGRAKAAAPVSQSNLITPEVSQLPDDPGLLRARIRLASGL